MEAYQQVIAAWNAQADETNQWDSLGEDEKIEWALKCADQFRGATKMVPQGWQMVPVEPTIVMIRAGRDTPLAGEADDDSPEDYRCVYRAMLAAAPQQPVPAVQGDALTREQIRDVFLANGFTIKEGLTDLMPYVYDAAYALLARRKETEMQTNCIF